MNGSFLPCRCLPGTTLGTVTIGGFVFVFVVAFQQPELLPTHLTHPPLGGLGKVVPGPSVQGASAGFGGATSPLLVKEGHACCTAPAPQIAHPLRMAGPRTRAAFATGDEPINAIKLERGQRPQQRLTGEKADCGGNFP